ncbi:MAG: thioredoxin family protein, partial [Bacteroidetes bacterium]|nr:thioredoxin family protein [Bacteroidota bacterium]
MFQFTKEKVNKLLSLEDYLAYTRQVIDKTIVKAPYDEAYYFSYTEANFKRSEKIRTQVELNKKLYNELNEGVDTWTWILITEPWCGDASFAQPIIEALCLAGNMELKIALRDEEEELMEAYLSNGAKAIPKLIVLNERLEPLFTWGPRPKELQSLIQDLLKNGGNSEDKLKLAHQWYRKYG